MDNKGIPEIFLESSARYRDNIAFNYFDGEWKKATYEELLRNVKAVASYLVKAGIQKGDRVAICSENRPEWGTAYLALSLAGCIGVPLDVQLGYMEIKNLVADSEAKVVFHSAKTSENVIKAIKETGADSLKTIPVSFDLPEFQRILNTPDIGKYPKVNEDDIASIIYTSGTTGNPKGVMLTHKNFCSDAKGLIDVGILSHEDSVISVLPLHHTYPFLGNCILPVFLGIPVSFPPSLKGPDLMATMRDFGVTMLASVPQLLELIRNGIFNKVGQLHKPLPGIMFGLLAVSGKLRRKYDINIGKIIFSSVQKSLGEKFRFSACGGAKLDPQVMKDLEALGLTILEGYGLTETSPVVSFNPIKKRKPGSVGTLLPSAEVRIIDPLTRQDKNLFEEGEIIIRGPMVMKGYYKNPEATAQVLEDGWFYSGDLGYMDNEGYLFITGRIKEVIVLSSGKNIYPDEVEKQYQKIKLIKDICVMGIEDKGMMESIHAVIVPDTEYAQKMQIKNINETLTDQINGVSFGLPSYMRLKGFTLHTEPLPRTPLGKLRRFMVKDLIKVRERGSVVKAREDEAGAMRDETAGKVIECVSALQKEKKPVREKDNLELDLGLDSLSRIELVVMLEKIFMIKLPETFTSEVQTVEELVSRVREYSTGKIGAAEKRPEWQDILLAEPSFEDKKKVGFHHSSVDRGVLFTGLHMVRFFSKLLFSLKATGLENIPEKCPYIITPNHASYLDAFMVASVIPSVAFKDLYSLGIQKYFAGKAGKTFARLANVIPIDQEMYLTKALQMSSYVLRNGKSLLVFPEGSRSFNGELMEFKKGVGILAMELNIPVVPAFIKGAFEALPRGSKTPRLVPVSINFGKPLLPSDIDMKLKPVEMDKYQFFANTLCEQVKKLER